MRKLILLAAATALMVPTAATAQRHDRDDRARHHAKVVRHARRDVREDRRESRNDRRVVRHERVRYVAPVRHWVYRPVRVGYRLQPVFYGSRYYITDYGAYHLQAPRERFLRWIRYGDDLLLVNIRTGRVLEVIHYRNW